MLLRYLAQAGLILGLTIGALPVGAHFQLIYNPHTQVTQTGDLPLKLIFWHPFANGHVMDMGAPEAFYAMHRGKKLDLMPSLSQTEFHGLVNSAVAYDASLPVKRSGDYVVVLEPAPYYEESEDLYIQQLTKAYFNRNELPTDWTEPQGLATEIRPLNKPYNVLVGSTFTGQVLANGAPVAGAEIEVEFMAAEPDMETNRPQTAKAAPTPGGTIVAISDANGMFTFGIPTAGYWGFAALGAGPETEFNGKELSQDAVIWIRAYDVK